MMTIGSAPWYALNSVFSPRAAARQLLAEQTKLWRLALYGIAAIFLSAWLANGLFLAFAPEFFTDDSFVLERSQRGVFLEALGFAVLAGVMVGATALVWKHVFGYRSPEGGAWVAAALTLLMSVVVSPLQELAFVLTHTAATWTQVMVFAAALVIGLGIPALYYVEIFKVGFARALILNVLTFFVLLIPFIFLLLVLAVIYIVGDGALSGLVTWLLT
jgi:hypothetical protein